MDPGRRFRADLGLSGARRMFSSPGSRYVVLPVACRIQSNLKSSGNSILDLASPPDSPNRRGRSPSSEAGSDLSRAFTDVLRMHPRPSIRRRHRGPRHRRRARLLHRSRSARSNGSAEADSFRPRWRKPRRGTSLRTSGPRPTPCAGGSLGEGAVAVGARIPGLYRSSPISRSRAGRGVFAPQPPEDKALDRESLSRDRLGTYHQLGGFFPGFGRIPRIVNPATSLAASGSDRHRAGGADAGPYLFGPRARHRRALPAPGAGVPPRHRPPAPGGTRRPPSARAPSEPDSGITRGRLVALTLLASGCGGGAPPIPPPAAGARPRAFGRRPQRASRPCGRPHIRAGPLCRRFDDAKGRRDPFVPIVSPRTAGLSRRVQLRRSDS